MPDAGTYTLDGTELTITGNVAIECPMCGGRKYIDGINLSSANSMKESVDISKPIGQWFCPCCTGDGIVIGKGTILVDISEYMKED